ncbi:MAG: hypothetical protein ABI305_04805 [Tepidiformaceae bacterium]
MAGDDFESESLAQIEQDEQESDGVRTAGDRCEDLSSSPEELFRCSESSNAFCCTV